jgi:hypothetical protein
MRHQVSETERMAELEAKNTDLQGKLSSMGPLHTAVSKPAPTSRLDSILILKTLNIVEGAQGGYDLVTLGGYHFHGIAEIARLS